MEKNNVTLISVLFDIVNDRKDIKVDDYIKKGEIFLKAVIPKVIFTDSTTYTKLKQFENTFTKIIAIDKNELYLYDYKDKITNFKVNSTYPQKDTLNYILLMCSKTEFIKKAIELNVFDTNYYIWIDFGIKYIYKKSDEDFIKNIEILNNKIQDKPYDKIRIGSIWNTNQIYIRDVYKDICWYFAGGVFGGHKNKLLEFATYTKDICIETIHKHNTLVWEVNIWYLVYLQHKELFDCYLCDHNDTLIDNF